MRLPTGVGRALAFDRAALAPGRAIRAALGVGLPLVIGAATVLLLFIGIHNSWDIVTYVVIDLSQPENKSQD